MSFEDLEIYQGKKASDLFKDIVQETDERKGQIDLLVSELKSLVKNANDATILVPLIRDYLEVGIKNTGEKNKLAAVVQKLITAKESGSSGTDGLGLSEEERAELLKEAESIAAGGDEIDDKIKNVQQKRKITLNLGED